MLETIYPQEEQLNFTDREHFLSLLSLTRDLLTQDIRKQLALSGFRRIGKTLILKEFLKRCQSEERSTVQVVYIDLPRLSFTPETFAVQYMGHLLYWLCNHNPEQHLESFYVPAAQLLTIGQMGKQELNTYFSRFHHELEKEKPDQHMLIEMAFNAPEVYASAMDRKVMLLLDEFPEILSLNNYPQIRDSLSLFRSVLQSQSHVAYVVAGSMIGLMERIFLHSDSPLFVHFQLESVPPFGRSDSDELVKKRLGWLSQPIPMEVLAEVFRLARGHPFYTYAVCMHVIESVSLLHKPLNTLTIQEAFTLETLDTNGRIYNLCRYLLEKSLKEVRGDTMPQAALQTIASESGGLPLSEIATRLKRPSGALHQVMNWLKEVDLIEQQDDKKYIFKDPILQIWMAYYYSGVELTGLPNQKVLSNLVKELMEKYERIAGELSLAKESQVRELIGLFNGQSVDGQLFGLDGTFHLPVFEQVSPYLSPDGQLEVDALAEGNKRWVVEIKWRHKRVGLKELQDLFIKADHFHGIPWCISQGGFTPEAEIYARENRILVSNRTQIEAIEKTLKHK